MISSQILLRPNETEKKFLEHLKLSYKLEYDVEALRKAIELAMVVSAAEKPAEARGGDNGTVPIEQQSPSSALPQQAQPPKNYKVIYDGTKAEAKYERMTQLILERERLITAERQKRLSPHRRLNNEEYTELMQRMNNAAPPPFKKKAPFSTRNNEGIGDGLPYS